MSRRKVRIFSKEVLNKLTETIKEYHNKVRSGEIIPDQDRLGMFSMSTRLRSNPFYLVDGMDEFYEERERVNTLHGVVTGESLNV